MDLQIKIFRWPNQANHVIMLARGTIDLPGLRQIFRKAAEVSGPLLNCKILIDLLDVDCKVESADVDQCFSECSSDEVSHVSKVALVAARANKQYDQLATISANLLEQRFKVAVFEDSNVAAEWLVDIA
jgi:hypothetical protein